MCARERATSPGPRIRTALDDTAALSRARALAVQMNREDGVGEAVKLIESVAR